eukprot:COSAG06_NODE_8827_length_2060_cov_6.395207_2_plen_156_part_00
MQQEPAEPAEPLENAVTPAAVLDMAHYLGIDPESEWDLLWLARECLVEPLPVGWEVRLTCCWHLLASDRVVTPTPCVCPCTSFGQEIISRHGQPQFVDRSSGLVLDVHPSDETFRAALREIRAAGPRVPDPDAEWMVFSDEFERSKGSHYWYNWL